MGKPLVACGMADEAWLRFRLRRTCTVPTLFFEREWERREMLDETALRIGIVGNTGRNLVVVRGLGNNRTLKRACDPPNGFPAYYMQCGVRLGRAPLCSMGV
jgi:hypothetical protein